MYIDVDALHTELTMCVSDLAHKAAEKIDGEGKLPNRVPLVRASFFFAGSTGTMVEFTSFVKSPCMRVINKTLESWGWSPVQPFEVRDVDGGQPWGRTRSPRHCTR